MDIFTQFEIMLEKQAIEKELAKLDILIQVFGENGDIEQVKELRKKEIELNLQYLELMVA